MQEVETLRNIGVEICMPHLVGVGKVRAVACRALKA